MPVRKMTPKERREWLGKGLIIPGGKRKKLSSEKSETTDQDGPEPFEVEASNAYEKAISEKFPDMARGSMDQPESPDQKESND
ncbi:hypothetical protein V6X62_04455 [Spiribacter sp. 218]|uniref:hypothetical protein n=1 Tax=Spiribacter pallidus TaxID=1987936 RepID=UPI00349F114A